MNEIHVCRNCSETLQEPVRVCPYCGGCSWMVYKNDYSTMLMYAEFLTAKHCQWMIRTMIRRRRQRA